MAKLKKITMIKTYKSGKNGKAVKPFSSVGNKAIGLFSTLFIAFLFMSGSLWAQQHDHCETCPDCPTGVTNLSCLTAVELFEGPECVQAIFVGNTGSCTDGSSVWFKFTPDTTCSYTFSTDNGAGVLLRDTWMKLWDECPETGGMVIHDCEDDNGDCDPLAAQLTDTLIAGEDYYLELGSWDLGNFCINVVKNQVPVNDCIADAISIDSLLTKDLEACCRWADTTFIYRPHDVESIFDNDDGPTPSVVVTSDPDFVDLNCNGGVYPNPNGLNTVFNDVWFKFTYSPSTMDLSWLNVYSNNDCVFYVMNLFWDNPLVANSFGCDTIKGLEYDRCAVGDQNPLTCGNQNGAENKSKNSFSNHPRLDLTGLIEGRTYYLRVSQFTALAIDPPNTDLPAPPRQGYFKLVNEAAPTAIAGNFLGEDGFTVDGCPTTATIDCGVPYHCLSTAGMTGNIVECNMPPAPANEPLLYYNNSAIYAFDVDSHLICGAFVTVEVSNIAHAGVHGLGGSFFVTNDCNGQVGFGLSSEFCGSNSLSINGLLTPGRWYIIVNGSRGNLLSYDLQVNIDYFMWADGIGIDTTVTNIPCMSIDSILVADCPEPAFKTTAGVSNAVSEKFKLNVSPVPSSGNVSISYLVGNDAPTTIEVYNMIGEKVYSKVVKSEPGVENTHMLDISSFTRGTYLVNLVNNNERTHAKMVKID